LYTDATGTDSWRDQRSHRELKSWVSALHHLKVKSSAKVVAIGDDINQLHLRGAFIRGDYPFRVFI